MKVSVTFKTPDAVNEAVEEALQGATDQFVETRATELKRKLSKWINYGEYVTIEFDLEDSTATVLET